MIYNLQVLRGVAALGVVFYHTNFRLPGGYHSEFYGVSTFFVISGFIVCFITRERADGFLSARLVRIVPLYWICTAALLLWMTGWAVLRWSIWTATPPWFPSSLLVELPRSLLFLPWDRHPLLSVGWTLNMEMFFYLVFAAALLVNRRMAPLITSAALGLLLVLGESGIGGFLPSYYTHMYTYYFIVGIGVYYASGLLARIDRPTAMAAIGGVVLAACYGMEFTRTWWNHWMTIAALGVPPLIVLAALTLEKSGRSARAWPLVLLGDASYAIYLSHTILFEVLRFKVPALNPADDFVAMSLYVVLSLVVGVTLHKLIEKPLIRAIKEWLAARRTKQAAIGFPA